MLQSTSRTEALATFCFSQCPQPHKGSIISSFRKDGIPITAHEDSLQILQIPLQKKSQSPRSPKSKPPSPSFSKQSLGSKIYHDRKMRLIRRPPSSFRAMNQQRVHRTSSTIQPISDEDAASQIERWLRWSPNRRHNQITGRILRDLISRRSRLEDCSLYNLLHAADVTIFNGVLGKRVQWRWSEDWEHQYKHDFLGTTALQAAPHLEGGYETLIVLSKPLLQDGPFSRDLLLSAFMHELVHCYLFLQCGIEHAKDDGHTTGFQRIAKLIDKWFGQQRLHLCNVRANLDDFRTSDKPQIAHLTNTLVDEGYVSRCASPGTTILSQSILIKAPSNN